MSSQPWRLHEWLPELLMSGVQQLLGLPGVAWLLPLGGGGHRPHPVAWPPGRGHRCSLATPCTSVAVVAMSRACRCGRTCVSFALAVAFTTPRGCARPRDGRPRGGSSRSRGSGPARHGMWFFGVVIGRRGAPRHRPRPGGPGRRQWLRLALVPLGSLAAAALTPTGPELLLSPFAVDETTQFIEEWMPPSLHQLGFVAFLVARRRPSSSSGRARAARRVDRGPARRPRRSAWPCSTPHRRRRRRRHRPGGRHAAIQTRLPAPSASRSDAGGRPDGRPHGARPARRRLSSRPQAAVPPEWGPNDLDAPARRSAAGTVLCNDYGAAAG